jgi:hypothetical protein
MRPHAAGPLLTRVAELLGEAAQHDGLDATVGVVLTDEGIDLHLRPLAGGEHVLDVLFGFAAPPDWDAIGVLTAGRARPLDAQPGIASEDVIVVHLQARDGQSCSLVGPRSGPLQASQEAGAGRIVDVCRRCLGLATTPAVGSPLRWWTTRWLDELCGAPALESWRHEAQLVELFPGGRPFGAEQTFAGLARHGRLLEETCSWETLRQAVAAGAVAAPGIGAGAVSWMDAGMFARWAQGELPDPAALVVEVLTRLAPGLGQSLHQLLRQWGVV